LTASESISSTVRACFDTHLPYALLLFLFVPYVCLNVVAPMSARSALQNLAAFLKSVCETAADETAGTARAAKATQTIHARFIFQSLLDLVRRGLLACHRHKHLQSHKYRASDGRSGRFS